MAKGSAELSEFAATKFEPMMTLRSKTLISSDQLQALGNVYARRPAQMSKFGSLRPHQIDGIWCIAFGLIGVRDVGGG
jgi:hypothetical protein